MLYKNCELRKSELNTLGDMGEEKFDRIPGDPQWCLMVKHQKGFKNMVVKINMNLTSQSFRTIIKNIQSCKLAKN